ncbi:MAG TPA: DUF308 domain-containing protein, partial [Candidatus Acidoferrales bacterium]|nr:DUF308 domain-containing protein [Candidatus Acidoferrales bacterium]
AAAVLFILLGIFSIVEPTVAGLGIALLVGWLLIFGGIAHLVASYKGVSAKQVIFQGLIGVAYAACGVYFLMHPALAVNSLTLLLGGVILAEGVLEVVAYFRMRAEGASGWMLFNGVITLLLGGMIWFHWPSSSVWAIGILVGVNLLMTGTARLMFGLAARKLVG